MARDTSKPTDRQTEYLTFIRDFTDRRGIPPSFEEIGTHFMTTAPSVNNMIKTLEARGFLTRVRGAPRTLRVIVPLATVSKPKASKKSAAAPSTEREIEAAVRLGSMTIERLVPAMKGLEHRFLHDALNAVTGAVDIAIVTAGGTEEQREDAFEALRRTAITAQGMVPESGPKGRRWVRRR